MSGTLIPGDVVSGSVTATLQTPEEDVFSEPAGARASATPSVQKVTSAPPPALYSYPIAGPLRTPRNARAAFTAGVNGTPSGYLPNQVRTAYGFNQISFGGLKGDGTGQTIAIIDWGDDPYMVDSNSVNFSQSDLHKFDVATGLPDPPSFTKVDDNGGTDYPSPDLGTDVEISIDVEWAHAMAPGANILLVEAPNAYDTTLLTQAVNYARNQPGVSEVSMSFGGQESGQETYFDSYFTTPAGHQGVTFLASTGDTGNAQLYPSTSPNVLAVGGTSLNVNSDNSYRSESAWSGSGGGISLVEKKPIYQESFAPLFNISNRVAPDISFLADPNTGVAIYDTADYGGWATGPWGGTSLATPMMAGLLAVANQGRNLAGMGTLDGSTGTLPDLYKLFQSSPADFHDITTGNNGNPAKPGYDLATGLGTPVANLLVPALVGDRPPVIKSLAAQPTTETAGTSFTLAANGVSDPDGGGVTVSFYRESNGIPGLQTTGKADTLLGTSTSGFTEQVSTAGLSPGNYSYYAVVTDRVGLSAPVVTASNTVTAAPIVPTPVTPANLKSTFVTSDSVTVTFQAPGAPNVVNRLAESTDGGANWINVGVSALTTMTVSQLAPGVPVMLKVRSADGTVYSSYSNTITVTPLANVGPSIAGAFSNVCLLSTSSSHLALDADTTQGLVNGNRIQVYTPYELANQRWDLDPNADGTYTIVNRASGKDLDANAFAIDTPGDKVQLWDDDGGAQQHWYINRTAEGALVIRSAMSGQALNADAPGQNTTGDTVDLSGYASGANQQWSMVRSMTGAMSNVSLLVSDSGLALDADATQGYVDGNSIQLWSNSGDPNQKWSLVPNSDGTYTIVNQACGKVLDANYYAINQNGCKVQLWDSDGAAQQHWYIDQLANGSVVIRNALSGLVLDANAPGDNVNGDLAQLWQYDAGANQNWNIA